MEDIGPVVIHAKVQIFLNASQVYEKRYILKVHCFKELKLHKKQLSYWQKLTCWEDSFCFKPILL